MKHLSGTVMHKGIKKSVVYSQCENFNAPVDVHKALKNKELVKASDGNILVAPGSSISPIGNTLDWTSWLPFCAKELNISPDPKDYILLPTIICPSDLPNRNAVGFPLQELIRWDTERHQQVYRGWVGCPTYSEHANDDCKKARGVVIDAVMRPVRDKQGNFWKVLGLAAFDRTKYPEVTNRLLTRETTTVSMGALVGGYSCSVCYAPIGACNHINPRKPRGISIDMATGKLVYTRCHEIEPFELSEVKTPAWSCAESPHIIDLANNTAYS